MLEIGKLKPDSVKSGFTTKKLVAGLFWVGLEIWGLVGLDGGRDRDRTCDPLLVAFVRRKCGRCQIAGADVRVG